MRHLEVESVFQAMTSRDPNRRLKEQQDGIKFRTLCETCNNDAIGRYDPALGRFTTEVAAILKSPLHLPPVIHLEMNPTAVARAILGHLVAANLRGDRPLDQAVRPLFAVNGQCLEESECLPIPTSIKIFYWIHRYLTIRVQREFAMPAVRGEFRRTGIFHLLKYYPLAYLVTDLDCYEGLPELTRFRHLLPSETASVPIDLGAVHDFDWPERTDPGNFVMMAQENCAVSALPKRTGKRG